MLSGVESERRETCGFSAIAWRAGGCIRFGGCTSKTSGDAGCRVVEECGGAMDRDSMILERISLVTFCDLSVIAE